MKFYSIHNHDYGSNIKLLDSISRPKDLVNKAIELGFNGLAITNHEVLSTHVDYLEIRDKLKKDNIDFQIIFGNEIYLMTEQEFENPVKFWHFILLAKDEIGYKQIRELSSRAWNRMKISSKQKRTPTFYSDFDEVVGNDKGHLIASSACLGNFLVHCILPAG